MPETMSETTPNECFYCHTDADDHDDGCLIGFLEELAGGIERLNTPAARKQATSVFSYSIVCGEDDARAIRWALARLRLETEERLRLLLVIDADAGSGHADREAGRLGLTIELADARDRRNENMVAGQRAERVRRLTKEEEHERTGGQD